MSSPWLFSCFLIYYGYIVVQKYFGAGTVTPMWRVPKWILFGAVPVSAAAMGLRLIAETIKIVKSKDGNIALAQPDGGTVPTDPTEGVDFE